MFYVPFVPPQSPSPRAYELSRRLIDVVSNYCRENPNTTNLDIRHALNITSKDVGISNQAIIAAILAGIFGLGILGFYFFSRQSHFGNQSLILAIIIVVGIFIVVFKAMRTFR